MEHRTCPTCGKDFEPTHWSQVYCPPTDEDRARHSRRSRCAKRAENAAYKNAPHHLETVECARCGKNFERHHTAARASRIGRHEKRYCSLGCQYAKRAEDYRQAKAKFPPRPRRKDETAYRRLLRGDPCAYCGGPGGALDHIEPKQHGGSDEWDNRTAACQTCNGLKGTLPLLPALIFTSVGADYHALRRALWPR